MDAVKPSRRTDRSQVPEVAFPMENPGSLHEESRHHVRLHEEAVPGPHRPAMSRHGAQQKIRPCEYIAALQNYRYLRSDTLLNHGYLCRTGIFNDCK